MKTLASVILISIWILNVLAFAQTYEKSGSSLKVTKQVEETYQYSDIKLKIQDLKDMQGEVLARAEQEIARLQVDIDKYTKLLEEADKLEVGKVEVAPIEEPIEEEIIK